MSWTPEEYDRHNHSEIVPCVAGLCPAYALAHDGRAAATRRQGGVPGMKVYVTGREFTVECKPGWTVGAVATHARWAAGAGEVPFDNWDHRDAEGRLLDPSAPAEGISVLWVDRRPGVGA